MTIYFKQNISNSAGQEKWLIYTSLFTFEMKYIISEYIVMQVLSSWIHISSNLGHLTLPFVVFTYKEVKGPKITYFCNTNLLIVPKLSKMNPNPYSQIWIHFPPFWVKITTKRHILAYLWFIIPSNHYFLKANYFKTWSAREITHLHQSTQIWKDFFFVNT